MTRPLLITLLLGATLGSGCFLVDNTPPQRGFALTWKIADAAAPNPETAPALACADVGLVKVQLDALDRDTNRRHRSDFPCDAMSGVTPALPQSNYQIFLAAIDGGGASRSQIRFDANNFDDVQSDLGHVIFTVNR